MKRILLVSIAALLTGLRVGNAEDNAQKFTEGVRDDLLQSVVSIEAMTPDGKGQPIGTGFLVNHPAGLVALVTAKHVVKEPDGTPHTNLAYRLNLKGHPSLLLPDSYAQEMGSPWFCSETHDLALKFVAFPAEVSDFKMIGYDFFLSQDRLRVAAPVVIAGFPLGLRSEDHTDAIIRRGIISLSKPGRLLVDAFTFPGNSGGPVFYVPTVKVPPSYKPQFINTEMLLGVVSGQISYVEPAISPQTRRPRVIFEDNAGLTEVVPATAIQELLERKDVAARVRELKPEYGEQK